MCACKFDLTNSGEYPIDGECPECGQPTVDGVAAVGCEYGSVECETCGWRPCNQSC
jgi:hypothetical protein